MLLHERIKDLRLSRNLTQEQLAQELHISRSAYALYETGKRQLGYDILCTIADFYQVNIDYLFGRTDNYFIYLWKNETYLKNFPNWILEEKKTSTGCCSWNIIDKLKIRTKKTRNNIQRLFLFYHSYYDGNPIS